MSRNRKKTYIILLSLLLIILLSLLIGGYFMFKKEFKTDEFKENITINYKDEFDYKKCKQK